MPRCANNYARISKRRAETSKYRSRPRPYSYTGLDGVRRRKRPRTTHDDHQEQMMLTLPRFTADFHRVPFHVDRILKPERDRLSKRQSRVIAVMPAYNA